MTDFWKEYDECLKRVRAERIVTERVLPIRHDVTDNLREEMAIRSIMSGIEVLEGLSKDPSKQIGRESYHQLDDADTRISLLRTRLKMRRGLVHLAGQFGRAP